jgi:hypothetical protein
MKEKLTEETAKERLGELREGLFSLHKALIASERVGYEEAFGPIGAPANFLRLLLNDPWFAWLRPLSGLMATVDEAMDGKEPLTVGRAEQLFGEARALLKPEEEGEGFGRHYFIAMQRDPDVLLAHAAVTKAGGKDGAKSGS